MATAAHEVAVRRDEVSIAPSLEALTFDVALQLQDYAALARNIYRSPAAIGRTMLSTLAVLVWCTVAIVVTDAFSAVIYSNRSAPVVAKEYFATRALDDAETTLMQLSPVLIAVALAFHLVLGPIGYRTQARKILCEYPDVDAADPNLTQMCHCRLDPDGCLGQVIDRHSYASWAHFTKLVETRKHLFLMMGPTSGIIFPRRAFEPALLEAVQSFVAERIRAVS